MLSNTAHTVSEILPGGKIPILNTLPHFARTDPQNCNLS